MRPNLVAPLVGPARAPARHRPRLRGGPGEAGAGALTRAAPAPAPAPKPAPGPEAPPPPEVHKIYVPFKDLQKVFEKEGQGVFVPYTEFRALWDRAYRMPDDPSRPPVAAAVRSAVYAGVAEGAGIRFTAALEIDVLAPGWQRLGLDFGGVGIEKATIGGEPALLVPTEKGYDLLLQGTGRRTLEMTFRVGAPLQGDTHVAAMSLPPVPLARLSLRVPGTDTDVQAVPRLAGSTGATADGATELLAYLGPVSSLQLTWRRRPDDAAKVDPLVFATESTDVLVDRGVVRTEFQAALSILRAPLDALTLVVPADAVVLYVEGNGIRSWERNAAGRPDPGLAPRPRQGGVGLEGGARARGEGPPRGDRAAPRRDRAPRAGDRVPAPAHGRGRQGRPARDAGPRPDRPRGAPRRAQGRGARQGVRLAPLRPSRRGHRRGRGALAPRLRDRRQPRRPAPRGHRGARAGGDRRRARGHLRRRARRPRRARGHRRPGAGRRARRLDARPGRRRAPRS